MTSPSPAPLEQLRPDQIAAKARHPGLLILPVSPAWEWHSYHLPVGTDALIAEEIAARMAARLDAIHCRALSLGLDEVRDARFKASQGLPPEAHIFGMNYPTLPVASEYTSPEVMRALLVDRISTARRSGFRKVVLLNHHGGCGQVPLLDALAGELTDSTFTVLSLQTRADDLFPLASAFWVGGHAGLAETMQLMAFRPDLIDLDALPPGPLQAAVQGILHDQPVIPEQAHPRHADPVTAQAWGDYVVGQLVALVNARL